MGKRYFDVIAAAALLCAVSAGSCQKMEPSDAHFTQKDGGSVPAAGDFYDNYVRIKVSESYAARLEQMASADGLIVETKAGTLFGTQSIKSMRRTFPYSGRFEARSREMGMHLWYDVELNPEAPATKAQPLFAESEGVLTVELLPRVRRIAGQITPVDENSVRRMSSEDMPFNDPMLPQQWHYHNDGSLDGSLAGADINVFPVWKEYTTGSSDVIVAVIDGGVDVDHEDLAANMWVNEAELNGTPGVDDDGNGYVDDVHGFNFVGYNANIEADNHGSHVAGTVAAVNNNGIGVSGVAGGDAAKGIKGARIMSCEIFTPGGEYRGFSSAIKYAADNGAVIAQNSWGYGTTYGGILDSDRLAIDYFVKNAGVDEDGNQTGPMKGGIVIFAAGNDNMNSSYPPQYEKCLAVSSMQKNFKRASYSNYGDWVDIAAPGGEKGEGNHVISCMTMENGKYGGMEGTSMACPHVSGSAALLVAQFGGDGFTPDMLREKLINSGVSIVKYNKGESYERQLGKLVNVYNAITRTSSEVAPDPVTDLEVSASSNDFMVKWTVTADGDETMANGFALCYGKTSFSADTDPYALPEGVQTVTFESADYEVGKKADELLRDLEFDTKYYVSMYSYDMSDNRSALCPVQEVTTGSNHAPVIEPEGDVEVTLAADEKKTITLQYSDPDNHATTWGIMRGSSALEAVENEPGTIELQFDAAKAIARSYEGRLTFKDKFGAETVVMVYYTIKGKYAPELSVPFENLNMEIGSAPVEFNLRDHFTDQDREVLSFVSAVSVEGVVTATVDDGRLTVAPVAAGECTVTVTASDTGGDSAEASFLVTVTDPNAPEVPETEGLSAYPNPVRDILNIALGGGSKETTVNIYTQLGYKVYSSVADMTAGAHKVDMTAYAPGSYTVEVISEGKVSRTSVIVL